MQLNHLIDHTLLKPTTLVSEIQQLCDEALHFQFAAVCVPPPFVKIAHEQVAGSNVKVATVIGFPFGYSAVEAKIAESVLAMVDGSDELDIVASIVAIKNHDWTYLANEINHLLPVIKSKNKVIKVIIESGVLTEQEIITCCDIYGAAGIDFLKTSSKKKIFISSLRDVRPIYRAHQPFGSLEAHIFNSGWNRKPKFDNPQIRYSKLGYVFRLGSGLASINQIPISLLTDVPTNTPLS